MLLNQIKYKIEEIDGIRCSVVDTGASPERVQFLKTLLEYNGYTVKTKADAKKDESAPDTFTVAVTDILLNVVIALYARRLKNPRGIVVSPACWNQFPEVKDRFYWDYRPKTSSAEENLNLRPWEFRSV